MNDRPKFKIPTSQTVSEKDQYSFEYKCIGYSIQPINEMKQYMSKLINDNTVDGYRYVESIRINPSEGILIFERKK